MINVVSSLPFCSCQHCRVTHDRTSLPSLAVPLCEHYPDTESPGETVAISYVDECSLPLVVIAYLHCNSQYPVSVVSALCIH